MGMAAVAQPPETRRTSDQAKSKYRPEIDGLRAFAIMAVIINHFNKDLLPSGYLGVDIFFVISGYVITSSLSGRRSENLGDFLSGFYERRIKRLTPALVVFVLISSILICLFDPNPATAINTGITSLFGLSNLYLFKQSTDYFTQSTELNPFTHTWSLGVEEQFYLLFPFLIWFSGFGRQAKNAARNLFLWVGALAVASLTGFIYLYSSNQPAAYFLMPSRFWEMAAGCLLFIGFSKRVRIEQTLERVSPLVVIALMIAVMFLPIYFAVSTTIAIVVLSAILLACLKSGTSAYVVFTNHRVVYLGLISYSLYLWHWGILSISRWSIGIHWWSVPLQIFAMILLAHGSYVYIETRARRTSWVKASCGSIAIGLALQAGAMAFVLQIQRFYNATLKTRYDVDQDQGMIPGTKVNRRNCHLKPIAFSLQEAKTCSVIAANATRNLIIMGDSHANAFVPAYLNPKIHAKFNLVTSTRPGARFGFDAGKIDAKEGLTRLNSDRTRYLINESRRGDVIVVVNHFLSDLDPLHPRPNTQILSKKTRQDIISKAISELDNAGSALKKRGATLVILAPLPNFHHAVNAYDISVCRNARFWQQLHSCKESTVNRSEMLARAGEVKYALLNAAKKKGFLVFDGFEAVCPSTLNECSTHFPGKPFGSYSLFRDMDHLSREGAIYLSRYFADFLERNGLLGDENSSVHRTR